MAASPRHMLLGKLGPEHRTDGEALALELARLCVLRTRRNKKLRRRAGPAREPSVRVSRRDAWCELLLPLARVLLH